MTRDRKPTGMGSLAPNQLLILNDDGVAMGSPLAPVLANLFMGHHEKRWLENYNSGIEFYRKYVDDTFALFNTEQDALSFFSYINSQHPNIKFTMEREETRSSPS